MNDIVPGLSEGRKPKSPEKRKVSAGNCVWAGFCWRERPPRQGLGSQMKGSMSEAAGIRETQVWKMRQRMQSHIFQVCESARPLSVEPKLGIEQFGMNGERRNWEGVYQIFKGRMTNATRHVTWTCPKPPNQKAKENRAAGGG